MANIMFLMILIFETLILILKYNKALFSIPSILVASICFAIICSDALLASAPFSKNFDFIFREILFK